MKITPQFSSFGRIPASRDRAILAYARRASPRYARRDPGPSGDCPLRAECGSADGAADAALIPLPLSSELESHSPPGHQAFKMTPRSNPPTWRLAPAGGTSRFCSFPAVARRVSRFARVLPRGSREQLATRFAGRSARPLARLVGMSLCIFKLADTHLVLTGQRSLKASKVFVSPGVRVGRQAGMARRGRRARVRVQKFVCVSSPAYLPPLRPALMPRADPSFLAAPPSRRGKLRGAEQRWRRDHDQPATRKPCRNRQPAA